MTRAIPIVCVLIAQAHRNFRFVDRYRALSRGTHAAVEQSIEDGFPHLPSGCDIRFDRESREIVLANVRAAIKNIWREMTTDLRALGDVRLNRFLAETKWELEDVYRPQKSYTALRTDAALQREGNQPEIVGRALPRLLYVDDDDRLVRWRDWLSNDAPPKPDPNDRHQLMLFAALGFVRRPVSELSFEAPHDQPKPPKSHERRADLRGCGRHALSGRRGRILVRAGRGHRPSQRRHRATPRRRAP